VKRYEEMTDKRAVSEQELDGARSRLEVANESVAEAETMLGYTRVTAPFDGVVTRKLADVGDQLAPGKPLVEMEDASVLRFEADLPEALTDGVAMGRPVQVQVDSLGRAFDATTTEIAPSADPKTRTFAAKFDFSKTDGLRAGQFGRVLIPVGKRPVLLVPEAAVVRRGQFELAFTVEAGAAHLRIVKTGRKRGDKIEIASGLGLAERVVIEGADRLIDAQPVEERP
jgi:RND family efflux transporter MFP subunit